MRFRGNPPWLSQSSTGPYGLPFRGDSRVWSVEHQDGIEPGPDQMRPSASMAGSQPSAEPPIADRGFERWLSRKLHGAHDSVLREPLPAELERLVQLFATADTADAAQPHSGTAPVDAPPFPLRPDDAETAETR